MCVYCLLGMQFESEADEISLFVVCVDLYQGQDGLKICFIYMMYFISQTYSGNVAPVGCTMKSNTMNSAVLVGCTNI